jgi:hypothetical protein
VSATSQGEQRLRSKSDFQRFCAELRSSKPGLDELVEALRALAASELRPTDRGRFALVIARHLGAFFPASDVRSVASREWPTEIAMALRSQAPTEGEPPVPLSNRAPDLLSERAEGVDLLELSRERGSPLTVVFLGDEDEHRASIDRLKAMQIHCLRESSLPAVHEAFHREAVVGFVVGASWWAVGGLPSRPPRQQLRSILELSNLCWVKLTRSAVWTSVEGELPELCRRCHLADSPRSRLAVEDQATITNAELRHLAEAIQDFVYAERSFSCESPLSLVQDRILRAATSRYLRGKYHALHTQEPGFRVRRLANRGEQGLASLVSVIGTDVSLVIKMSPYLDALEEARRFRSFAHGTAFEMDFFCHGMQGALVFAPVNARLGQALSLEDKLARRELVGRRPAHEGGIAAIDSTIAALQRFSQQLRPEGVDTFCIVEFEGTETLLRSCGPITVAGQAIDLGRLYAHGLQALDRCAGKEAVQHGDAHPGNILFSATNTAVLIDYECAGLGPACYDLTMLWIHVLASQFVAVGDEHSTVSLLRDLLQGMPVDALEKTWSSELRFAVSQEVVYLAHRAIDASVSVMATHGCAREDVYGIVAIVLCREFLNSRLQQFVIRCALAAISSLLRQDPE